MTNFDFLKSTPDFDAFADVAISAERILHIDVDSCVLNCRRAMEFAVKWMYSVDRDLVMPYQDIIMSALKVLVSSPLGPLTVTTLPSATLTVTPAGITTGFLPILDIP